MSTYIQTFNKNITGKVVEGYVDVDVGEGEMWPALRFTDGSLLVIQCDAEGNGGGFMQLESSKGELLGFAGAH